ncbi:hypothetical protein NA56DRAFT_202748 [Hyaloscypha hepaticicola]|uniref:Uncharacterized protein n=1 Tax=Hyaloscypha hepaticicola TaxID=2082293 RepID=A0A2J6PZI4_9HELO|nr:hypothetical protein NA56DRAFT_202748 [Hyaloscypha hepaticicola]
MSIFQPSTPSNKRRAKRNVLPGPTFLICTSFAAPLYHKCTAVLACAIHLDINPEVKLSLKQSLARLGLWKNGLQDGHLDKVLSESPDIGYALVHFLNALASLLSKDVVPFLIESTKSANLSATRKLAAELGDLNKKAEDYLRTNSDNESDDSDSDDEDRMDVDLESAPTHNQIPSTTANKINFYVSRLMDLLPAIEAVLEVQHTQRESSSNGSLNKELEQHNRAVPLMFAQKRRRRENPPRLKLEIQRSRNMDKGGQMESISRPKLLPSVSFPCESSIDGPLGNRTMALRREPEFASPTRPISPFSFDFPLLFRNTKRMVVRTRSDSCLQSYDMNECMSPRLMIASSP